MGNYRILDDSTSNSVCADGVAAALAKYFRDYSTSGLTAGENFDARVYNEETDELLFTCTATADGAGGVLRYDPPGGV